MTRIVTVTLNPTVDKSTSVPTVVAERKLRCAQPRFEPGGGGINVSHALHKLGESAEALWTKGGHVGAFLETLLEGIGIAHKAIPIAETTRENLIVFEESTTHQFRYGMPGPNLTEDEGERIKRAVHELSPAPDYLILSGSLPPGLPDDFYAQLARSAPEHTKVVLDASGKALRSALDAGVYLVKPNLSEFGQLLGAEPSSDAELERASRALISEGKAELVLTSLGAGGAMLVTREVCALIRSPTVPIRSKVGAGDSMVAGTVLGLVRYPSIYDAARLGVAAGAAAVMTDGTELCRREDVERLFTSLRETYPSIVPSMQL